MSQLVKVRMKVNDIVGGGVYFIGEELFTTPEAAEQLVRDGKVEIVPARSVSMETETGLDTPLSTTATRPPVSKKSASSALRSAQREDD